MAKTTHQDILITKTKEFRKMIINAENKIKNMPDVLKGEALDKHCPVKHSYGDGCYIREIFMPAGTLIVSKIHKSAHPYFVLKGKALVGTETGVVEITAPYWGMTLTGTKRALFIQEDMIWITVHVTKETELEKIEKEIIATDFQEVDSLVSSLSFKNGEKLCLG